MRVQYATEDEIRGWFGGKVPASMRAIVVKDGDDVLGVAGVVRAIDHVQAFSHIKESLRGHKVTMGRAAVMFRGLIGDYTGPIFAVCAKDEPTSPTLLSWLGFEKVYGEVWQWHG